MTPEEVDKIEELIRAIILQERPDFPSGWRAHNARVAAAKDALANPSETVILAADGHIDAAAIVRALIDEEKGNGNG